VLKAVEYAKKRGAFTIGLTGFDGGALRKVAHENIHVATPHGDYGPVEDIHLILGHLVASYLARLTAGAPQKRRLAETQDTGDAFQTT
jgi:D-sedoheptulose 7-phosphate isomerase